MTTKLKTTRKKTKSNVVSLDGGPVPLPRAIPEVVDLLTGLLADAKDGKIAGFVFLAIDSTGFYRRGWEGDTKISQMVGMVSQLQHDMIGSWTKSQE